MNVVELATQFPTPFYAYDGAIIAARNRELLSAFASQRVQLYYAVKANDNPSIIARAAVGGIGACLVSHGEFERACAGGIAPALMLMNGIGKSREDIRAALRSGIGQLNVESLPELQAVAQTANELGLRAPICVRINPEIAAGGHSHTSVARRTDKFGLLVEDLGAVREIVAAHPCLDWRGFSCHIGSQIHGEAELEASYRFMSELFRAERVTQPAFDRLDLGGGFGVSYCGEHYARPGDYAALLAEVTGDLQADGVTIQLEPGRFLVAESGALVTRVLRVKDSGGAPSLDQTPASGTRFIIVDAAMNDLIRPTLYEAYHPIALGRESHAHRVPCTVAGPLCESADMFARARHLPEDICEGDILVIGFAGAYGHVMSSMYNARARLAEVLVEGGDARLIRRALTAREFDRLTLMT